MWLYMTEDGVLHAHSGTILQKDIWATPSLHSSSPAFMWVYNHVLLKARSEVVVEEMCEVIGRQADSTRSLSIQRYAKEARLAWSAPLQHKADPFLKKFLDHKFGPGNKWYLDSNDKQNKLLVSRVSHVVNKLKKCLSKFFFMKAKSNDTQRAMSIMSNDGVRRRICSPTCFGLYR
jgi:hypothetical protein